MVNNDQFFYKTILYSSVLSSITNSLLRLMEGGNYVNKRAVEYGESETRENQLQNSEGGEFKYKR